MMMLRPKQLFMMLAVVVLTAKPASAGLTWETRRIDGSPLPGEKTFVASFNFQNTGPVPVTIREIQTGCECTVAQLDKRTFASGEAGVIKTVFTLGDRSGQQDRVIKVLTDDPEFSETTLTLHVEIPERLSYTTRMLHWKHGSPVEEKSVEVTAVGQNRLNKMMLGNISPTKAAARIEMLEDGTRYRLHIKPTSIDAPQTVALSFQATFDDGSEVTFIVYALTR
jgi:hypothetical protein